MKNDHEATKEKDLLQGKKTKAKKKINPSTKVLFITNERKKKVLILKSYIFLKIKKRTFTI